MARQRLPITRSSQWRSVREGGYYDRAVLRRSEPGALNRHHRTRLMRTLLTRIRFGSVPGRRAQRRARGVS